MLDCQQAYSFILLFAGGVDTASTDGTFDISNSDRLGRSEVELMQIVVDGITTLVDMEKLLEAGKSIDHLVPALNINATREVYKVC